MSLPRAYLEHLIFGPRQTRRYTQDSPVLPEVWIHFGSDGNGASDRLKVLVTPHRDTRAGALAVVLRRRLAALAGDAALPEDNVPIYSHGYVAAELSLRELVRAVLPLTRWWKRVVLDHSDAARPLPVDGETLIRRIEEGEGEPERRADVRFEGEFTWMVNLIGTLLLAPGHERDPDEREDPREPPFTAEAIVDAALAQIGSAREVEEEHREIVHQVNRNRPVEMAISESVPAIKADASRRVFATRCKGIRWAVVDSGIDASHPAFYDWSKAPDVFAKRARDGEAGRAPRTEPWEELTRIKRSYDLTRLRELLRPNGRRPEELPIPKEDAIQFKQMLQRGADIDWSLVEPLLRIEEAQDRARPYTDHGTHVAGILGAGLPAEGSALRGPDGGEGVCPDLEIWDIRVLRGKPEDDEFGLIAALQFIRYLNANHGSMVLHGANLSVSVLHDVTNFACGRTPVCDEAERLVASGVVVVAAAGNEGYLRYQTATGPKDGYHTISITDPGNAEKVITVGATHRYKPHTYGVSYFSSRGPTGDGRIKPDLVAPGEKVEAPVPGGEYQPKDGTSMAAPHVSGAAALILAEHRELIGRPDRIKEIICNSATELGRERYFQGAGMLDVLRALQSV